VAGLQPHVDLGQDGLEVEVEAAAEQVRVQRALVPGPLADGARTALPLRLVAVAERCVDRLREAVAQVVRRLDERRHTELVRGGPVLPTAGGVAPLAAGEVPAIGGREPAGEVDRGGERDGPGLAGPELDGVPGARAVVAHAPGVAAGEGEVRDHAAHGARQRNVAPGDAHLRPGAFLGRLFAGARADRQRVVV